MAATSGVTHPVPAEDAMEDKLGAVPRKGRVEIQSICEEVTSSGTELDMSPTVQNALPGLINDKQCQAAQLALHEYLQQEPHLRHDGSMLELEVATGWLQMNPMSAMSFIIHANTDMSLL